MENFYKPETRNAAPKVVIFKTAVISLLLVGALTTASEVISFVYIEVAQLNVFLLLIWPGMLGFACGVFAAVYIYYSDFTFRWFLAKIIAGLATLAVFSSMVTIVYRIILVKNFLGKAEIVTDDKLRLVILHFSFSMVLQLALFALSVLIANITITMYKLRLVLDRVEGTKTTRSFDSVRIDTRYQNLEEEAATV